MLRIAVLDDYQGVAMDMANWASLATEAELRVFRDHLADENALVERLKDFQVIMAMRERTPFPRRLLERLPQLKLLTTTGMRNASIDIKAATDLGIAVCGTDGLPYPTAELTWGLILALVRHIPEEHRAIQAGRWQTALGVGLQGKNLGVLGLGRLGSQVAVVGRAFRMSVIAWSQNLTLQRAAEYGATRVEKDELFRQSDILTIHLVLSDRTHGLVGARELGLMKSTAYLVNTSRGPIVEEAALLEALSKRTIAGAALDVFDEEPLPMNHLLRHLDNVILTPHIGYVTKETYEIFYQQTVENIQAFIRGEPVRVLNPRVLKG